MTFAQWVQPDIRPVAPGQPTPVTAGATAGTITPPVLGFIAGDAATQVRVIVGIPGSASLTTDISPSSSDTRVSIPPRQQYVLAETEAPQALTVVAFSGLNPGSPAVITGALPGADLVSFSPAGSVAALYFRATQRLQVIAGLPAQPLVAWDVTIPGSIAPFRTVTVSDDASFVIGTTADSVVVVPGSDSAQSVYTSTSIGNLALIPQTSDAIVWDFGKGSLIQLRGLSGAVTDEVVASNLSFRADSNVQVTSDSQTVLVADPSGNTVVAFDLTTHAATQIATVHPPRLLTPLRAANIFLLSADPGKPAWILEVTQTGAANSYFVAEQKRQLIRVPESSTAAGGLQASEEVGPTHSRASGAAENKGAKAQ
jgi:hypothetical protein